MAKYIRSMNKLAKGRCQWHIVAWFLQSHWVRLCCWQLLLSGGFHVWILLKACRCQSSSQIVGCCNCKSSSRVAKTCVQQCQSADCSWSLLRFSTNPWMSIFHHVRDPKLTVTQHGSLTHWLRHAANRGAGAKRIIYPRWLLNGKRPVTGNRQCGSKIRV